SAAGSGTCAGDTALSFNLSSDLYLTGDSLAAVPGIQPCPVCRSGQPTSGTCTTGTCCIGGVNNGIDCTPGSSDLGTAYPVSHDCPPSPSTFIGALPIPFALTTGTASKTAAPSGNQTETFCGFCRSTVAPNNFRNPPTPCTSNAGCSTFTGFTRCEQRTEGAFGNGIGHTITVDGSPAGCLADRLGHHADLVSAFCIPPSYNGVVDSAADLPGPGAVS